MQGNVLTPVFQSFCSQDRVCLPLGPGGCLPLGLGGRGVHTTPRHTSLNTPPDTQPPLDTHTPWTHIPLNIPWTHPVATYPVDTHPFWTHTPLDSAASGHTPWTHTRPDTRKHTHPCTHPTVDKQAYTPYWNTFLFTHFYTLDKV